MANDKWNMFKQYMHNELGISKEDIREWIREAVKEEVKQLVQQSGFTTKDAVRQEVLEQLRVSWNNNNSIRHEIQKIAGEELAKNIVLTLKKNS